MSFSLNPMSWREHLQKEVSAFALRVLKVTAIVLSILLCAGLIGSILLARENPILYAGAGIGCLVLMVLAVMMYIFTAVKLQAGDLHEADAVHSELSNKKAKELQMEAKIRKLELDLEHQKTMCMQTTQIQKTLEITVAKIDYEITDFKDKFLEEKNERKWHLCSKEVKSSYLRGVIHCKGTLHLGVDTQKLFISPINADTLCIWGKLANMTTRSDTDSHWKMKPLTFIETHTDDAKKELTAIEVDITTPPDEIEKHRREIEQRLECDYALSHKEALTPMIQDYLKLMLDPLKKKIIFSSSPEPRNALPLVQFIERFNAQKTIPSDAGELDRCLAVFETLHLP